MGVVEQIGLHAVELECLLFARWIVCPGRRELLPCLCEIRELLAQPLDFLDLHAHSQEEDNGGRYAK